MTRGLSAWLVLVGVAALLVSGCGERSPTIPSSSEPGGTPAQRPRPVGEQLQGTLDRVRREQEIPGAAAAVVMPGGRVWVGVSGLADVRTRQPVRAETLFAVASVTKTFVAALVLELAEDGALGLDDRLSRWVPEFPDSRRITLRQLLNHTAGTADFVTDGRFLAEQRRRGLGAAWTPQQLLRYVPEPLAQPGERWHYSNARTPSRCCGRYLDAAGRTEDDPDFSFAYGAQAAEILLDAIARSDGTRASVNRELRATRVEDGILGDIRFDASGDLVEGPVTIYRVTPKGPTVDRVVTVRATDGD